MKSTAIILLSLIVAVTSQDEACPDFALEINLLQHTIGEVVSNILDSDGPSDGTCEGDKFIYTGKGFDKPPKCKCFPKSTEIVPGQGRPCAPWIKTPVSFTLTQAYQLNYYGNPNAPADGWCEEGVFKWNVPGVLIGKGKRDTCYCIRNYDFYYYI